MHEQLKKFLEQMDAEEKRKHGPRKFMRDHGAFFQVKTATGYDAYQVDIPKLFRWVEEHSYLDLGINEETARVIDFRPTPGR
jgi:hypothetical protein